jgi:hypothetical protein
MSFDQISFYFLKGMPAYMHAFSKWVKLASLFFFFFFVILPFKKDGAFFQRFFKIIFNLYLN